MLEKLLTKLEKLLGHKGIPDLTLYLVAGQILMFFFAQSQPDVIMWSLLSRDHVLNGEVWRLITFLLIPPSNTLIFSMIAWFVFYSINKSLELQWGTCRLTIYLAVGYIATIVGTFIGGVPVVDNNYFLTSTFLAFATLYPDIEFLLFFIIPVRVRYLAIFTAVFYLLACFSGGLVTTITVLSGVVNYFLFFGSDLYAWARQSKQRLVSPRSISSPLSPSTAGVPRHTCVVCAKTDTTNPELDFRYCSKCPGSPCFCLEHLKEHKGRVHQIG